MVSKKLIYIYVVIGLLVSLLVSLFFNYKQWRDSQEITPTIKDVTTYEIKENKISDAVPQSENSVGSIKGKLPTTKGEKYIAKTTTRGGKYISMSPGGAEDSAEVVIPITQKKYEDSTYTAYVSGYKPNLDSITIRSRVITHTITETKIKKAYRKINIGIIAGYSYNAQMNKFGPTIGVGVCYNIFK